MRAARAAQLDEFVGRLPDHYDTRVGERGVRLSGGERQCIAIARAILKNPRIIVFDEATSALDTRSERAIQVELTRLAQGRTSIAIAQRLSTVVDADWILVMEHGRMVEQGAHDELLKRDGVYAKMWSLQWQQGELEHLQRKLSSESRRLDTLITEAVAPLQREIKMRRLVWKTFTPAEDLQVTGDPLELKQVIATLCRSEIEQTRQGGHVGLRVERHENHAWLSVAGEHDRPLDLSLASARLIEEKLSNLGGGLTVKPEGSRFAYVAMVPLRPIVEEPGAAGSLEHAAMVAADQPGMLAGLCVLAIDDQEDALDALEAVLRASGARVLLAASGDDALAVLSKASPDEWPDIALCDIMPGVEDGYQVLERIREVEAQRSEPVSASMGAVALTGYTQAKDDKRARQAEFDVYLSKPIAAHTLIDVLLNVAAGRGMHRQNRLSERS